jgi:hypothetical protein
MTDQFGFTIILCSHVTMKDRLVSRSSTQEFAIPSNAANATLMPRKICYHLALGCVPDLKHARIGTHRQVVAPVRPLNASHRIILAKVVELGYFT